MRAPAPLLGATGEIPGIGGRATSARLQALRYVERPRRSPDRAVRRQQQLLLPT